MAGVQGAVMHRRNFLQQYFCYSAAVMRLAMALVLATSAAMADPLSKAIRSSGAAERSRVVVFWEDAFPAADTAPKGCLFVVTEVNPGGPQKKR